MTDRSVGVLFVCTGNICRSPTAEGVFRSLVEAERLHGRIEIDSAGTLDYHTGNPPDRRSRNKLRATIEERVPDYKKRAK